MTYSTSRKHIYKLLALKPATNNILVIFRYEILPAPIKTLLKAAVIILIAYSDQQTEILVQIASKTKNKNKKVNDTFSVIVETFTD